jgi:hypothetical protein
MDNLNRQSYLIQVTNKLLKISARINVGRGFRRSGRLKYQIQHLCDRKLQITSQRGVIYQKAAIFMHITSLHITSNSYICSKCCAVKV